MSTIIQLPLKYSPRIKTLLAKGCTLVMVHVASFQADPDNTTYQNYQYLKDRQDLAQQISVFQEMKDGIILVYPPAN